jgi:cobalt-zinc-cadmium efflux system outer membrane protein
MAGRRKMLLSASGMLGLAMAAGCRLASIGEPPIGSPNLDLNIMSETTQSPRLPRPLPRDREGQTLTQRLEVPREIPGAHEPPVTVPPLDPTRKEEREKLLNALYDTLPGVPPDPVSTQGFPVELADLQQQAMAIHPNLRAAAAAVEAARGAALQAGLPPNPAFGFEGDTIGSGGTAGQQGAKYEQLIRTAGKLKLAQSAALMDLVNAQVALRRAQIDVATQVRSMFFGVLVAEENLRLTFALCQFVDSMYRVQTDQVRTGQMAPYEPIALRALAEQARVNLHQARNRHQAAWRQLAVAIGQPDMAPAPLAGNAIMGEPQLSYELLCERMLANHTDLLTAANTVIKARYELALARVMPIPDVNLKLVVQKDYSTPPFATVANVEIGMPIPVWDRNQGNIRKAEAEVAQALEEIPGIRLDLLNRLAEASERYLTNRQTVDTYLLRVLPDQVRAYRGIVQRSQQEPDRASFGDIVTAQQQITSFLTTYLAALAAQWQAAVDLAALAQLDDLYQFGSAKAGEFDVGGK